MHTVSVLIPVHNDEEHLGDCIESALNQTWPNCEIIVVDDGSTDKSRSVARRYKSEGVQVIPQENQGAPVARNRAFRASTGGYIQYLDADDLLAPRKIEAQISALQSSPESTVAVCSTVYFQDGMSPEGGDRAKGVEQIPWLTSEDPVQWLTKLWTPGTGWGMVQTGAWLTPRSVIEKAGPWKEYVSPDDDGEFYARVLLNSSGIRYVGKGCVYYRKHATDATRVSGLRSKTALKGWIRSIDSKRDHLLPRATDERYEQAAYGLARQYWSVAIDAYPDHLEVAETAERRAAELGHSEPLRTVSKNGWKGEVAQTTSSLFGWRAARRLQWIYHGCGGLVVALRNLTSSLFR